MNLPSNSQQQRAWLYTKDGVGIQIETVETLFNQDPATLLSSMQGSIIAAEKCATAITELSRTIIDKTCKPTETSVISKEIFGLIRKSSNALQSLDIIGKLLVSMAARQMQKAEAAVNYVQNVVGVQIVDQDSQPVT